MSRVSTELQAVGFALVLVAGAAPTGAGAQGLVHMQKLSAPLANELVGDAVANKILWVQALPGGLALALVLLS